MKFNDGTPEQLEFFYRRLSVRDLEELIVRITDHIDCNPERQPFQVALADEARTRRALVQRVLDAKRMIA